MVVRNQRLLAAIRRAQQAGCTPDSIADSIERGVGRGARNDAGDARASLIDSLATAATNANGLGYADLHETLLGFVRSLAETEGDPALATNARSAAGGLGILTEPRGEAPDSLTAANRRLAEAERRNFEARMADHRARMAARRRGA